jgi:hypothetical protein
VVLRLEAGSLEREKILLWSLGLDTKKAEMPRAAVLYGRARWIGPLVKGDEITAHNLSGLLSIIGADCECGLDISWTQGTRLLVRWGEERHAQLTKALGFDPESPMVKLEVSRILGRRGSAPPAQMGYQEVSLEPVASGQVQAGATPERAPGETGKAPTQGRSPASRPIQPAEGSSILGVSLIAVGGLSIIVFAVGLIILWRARKPKTE